MRPWLSMRRLSIQVSLLVLAFAPTAAHVQAQALSRGQGATCGKPFSPSARMIGSTVNLPATGVSLSVPTGWRWQQTTGNDGSPIFQMTAPTADPTGIVLLAASDAYGDKSLAQVATETRNELVGNAFARTLVSRNFSLQGRCGLQVISRTPAIEAYVTLVRNGIRLYVVAAKYSIAGSAAMRGGLDTIVASAVLPSPAASPGTASASAPGTGLDSRIQGCWQAQIDNHTVKELQLHNDGTYRSHVQLMGLDFPTQPKVTFGRYVASGDSLVMSPDGGRTSTSAMTLTGERLTIDGTRYFPCN
jgi:hypothetical protein